MNKKIDKKMLGMIGAGVLVAAGVIMVLVGLFGGKGSVKDNPTPEPTTATDLFAVELTDKEGNKYTLEGVGVTDESGKTVITVTDKEGNKTVITGDAATDASGKKTVNNAEVTEGGSLVASNGMTINTGEAVVDGVKNNNDGALATDVAVSAGTALEVIKKQEQASKEAASREAASREETRRQEESSEAPTPGNVTGPTQPSTQAPTAPTAAPTQAATTAPTTAATAAPTQAATAPTEAQTETLSWEQQFVKDCRDVTDKGTYIRVTYYQGKEENLVVPSYINGKPVRAISINQNPYIKTITLPDTVTECTMYRLDNLEVVNMGKGLKNVCSEIISTCPKIREVNIAAETVILEAGWSTSNIAIAPYFSGATLNFKTSPDKVKGSLSFFQEEYTDLNKSMEEVLKLVNYDYRRQKTTSMYSSVNFNVK